MSLTLLTEESAEDKTSSMDMQFSRVIPKLLSALNLTSVEGALLRGCQPFLVENTQVGLIRPDYLKHLTAYKDVFLVVDEKISVQRNLKPGVHLSPDLKTYKDRTKAVNNVLKDLRKKDIVLPLRGWRHENYCVSQRFKSIAFLEIERAASGLFGFIQYGVHVNGFTRDTHGNIKLWIARRSKTKQTFPDMYDSMCAGGLAADLEVIDCVKKECQEEASVSEEILKGLKFVNNVSYFFEDERGLFPMCQFVFDLELDDHFEPVNSDGEVSGFEKLSINEVKALILKGNFKPSSAAVVFEFFLRHGFISPEDPNIICYVEQLHTSSQSLFQ